jgi:superfamily II DNA or RNA helicase
MILDRNSETLKKQPEGVCTNLKPHQLTALFHAKNIEKNSKYGVLKDPAGSGKTAVMIGLILDDIAKKNDKITLVVVPENIHNQWISELKKISGNAINILSLNDYESISRLMFSTDILSGKNCILITSIYYEMVMAIIVQEKNNISRLIIDEVDAMTNIMDGELIKINHSKEIHDKRSTYENIDTTWFVSASMINIEDLNGNILLGSKRISKKELENITIETDPKFINESMGKLDDPISTDIICSSEIEDFCDVLSVEQLDCLNSLSFFNCDNIKFLQTIVDDHLLQLQRTIENIEYYESLIIKKDFYKEKSKASLKKQLVKDHKTKQFYISLLELIYKKVGIQFDKNLHNTSDEIKKYLIEKNKLGNCNTKQKNIEGFLSKISNDKSKILFFSDYQNTFRFLKKLLDKYSISYDDNQGGTIEKINKSINDYKSENGVRCLLLDSTSNSRGMNLENTDIIVFIHKTKETLNNQIIGRAQRPGRNTRLEILNFLNDNEIVEQE